MITVPLVEYPLCTPVPLWAGDIIQPPYLFVSYEVTKRVSRWQCVYKHSTTLTSCVTSTGMPAQNAAHIPILSCSIHTQPLLHMVQYFVDWVALFHRSQHSPPHPLKLFPYIPPSIPPSPPSLLS